MLCNIWYYLVKRVLSNLVDGFQLSSDCFKDKIR